MKNAVLMLLTVCTLFLCAAGTAETMHREIGNDAFDMEVTVGYDGMMTYGKAMPVRVRIRNFGSDFEGRLGVNTYINSREYDRYEREIALPAGSEREFVLPVTAFARQEQFTVEIVKDGEAVFAANGAPESVINPSAMMVGVLSTRPQNLNNLTIDRENDVLARYELWKTVPLTAETFPEDASLLKSFGMLVIDDVDPASLNRKQQDLLFSWLRNGRVILCGGGSAAGKNISFFGSMTGLKLEGMTTTKSVPAALEDLIGRTQSGKTFTTALAEYSGAEPLARDAEGHGLIYRTQAGAGRIYTTAFEMGDPRLNGESLMHYFWQQLLIDQDQELYSSVINNDSDIYNNAAVTAGYSTSVHARSFLRAGLLVVAGMLVLGCVIWWILKKKDRRQWMWLVLPVLSVLAAAGIMLLSSGADTSRPLAVIADNMVQDMTGAVRIFRGISAAVPEFGRHAYSTAGENFRVQTYDYVDYNEDDEEKKTEPYILRTSYTAGGEDAAVSVESLTPWQQVNLTAEQAAQIQGAVDGTIWMEEDGLHGEIVNGTDMKLSAGYVITSCGYVSVPALAPGEKAEYSLVRKTFADPQNQKYEDGGLYQENPGLYMVISAATGFNDGTPSRSAKEEQEQSLMYSLISGATETLRRGQGGSTYGGADSTVFAYSARPENAPEPELHVDGQTVENQTSLTMMTAWLSFATVGRTGVVFRSAGMDTPVRMETDENLMPTGSVLQNVKQYYYHSLDEVPTFLFSLEGMKGVEVKTLQVVMDTYYAGQARAYALNTAAGTWDEIQMNTDIINPGNYLSADGQLYLQFRNDSRSSYADIPTPMINLEGRVNNAQN